MKPFFQRNLRRALLGIFGATLVIGGLSACGHRGDREWGANISPEQYAQKRDKMVDRVAGKLDLTADQKKLLANVGDTFFAQRKAIMGQTDPRAELKSLIAGPKFDAAKAQTLINDKTAAVQTRSPEMVTAFAAFYDSLNAAQQQKVRDYMEGRHGWFHRG